VGQKRLSPLTSLISASRAETLQKAMRPPRARIRYRNWASSPRAVDPK
jgi:hypothetical protein